MLAAAVATAAAGLSFRCSRRSLPHHISLLCHNMSSYTQKQRQPGVPGADDVDDHVDSTLVFLDRFFGDDDNNDSSDESQKKPQGHPSNIRGHNRRRRRWETKSGWCLREGLTHLCRTDERMLELVRTHGPPMIYRQNMMGCRHDDDDDDDERLNERQNDDDDDENLRQLSQEPTTCFQSLCRIIAGQQLAGAAAKTVWARLLETTNHNLTPRTILDLTSNSSSSSTSGQNINNNSMEVRLQKPAGLSRAKTRSIVALAEAFDQGTLSNAFLTNTTTSATSDEAIRQALLAVRGIGPWSADMFSMFYLERSNILPVGDLGVRKGLAKFFGLRGKGKNGSLCPIKDEEVIREKLAPYHPYHSLVSYYMWKVADTKDVYHAEKAKRGKKSKTETSSSNKTKTKRARVDHAVATAVDIDVEVTAAAQITPKKATTMTRSRQVTP